MIRPFVGGMLVVLALTSCDTGPTVPADASWLRASLSGPADPLFEGTGAFDTGSDPRRGVSIKWTLNSEGTSAAPGRTLMLYRQGDGRPERGTYTLGLVDQSNGKARGFTAFYMQIRGDTAEAFAARSGVVEITRSTTDRVEGTFRFTGVRYSARSTGGRGGEVSGDPTNPTGPTIEVSGEFSASRADDGLLTRKPE